MTRKRIETITLMRNVAWTAAPRETLIMEYGRMSAPEIDPSLASEVARQKKIAIEDHARADWGLGASFISGVIAAGVTWFIAADDEIRWSLTGDEIRWSLTGFFGLGTVVLGCLLGSMLFPKRNAKCPQCGHDWNIGGPETQAESILTWNCCPGCGLKIRDDVGCREKP